MKHTILALTVLFSAQTYAETKRVVQVDKTFMTNITDKQASEAFDDPSIEEKNKAGVLTAKVGDKIQFSNRDEVSHNVSGLIGEETQFDVKIQDPGAANDRTVELTKKGEYSVQCAIHPKMRFKIKVD